MTQQIRIKVNFKKKWVATVSHRKDSLIVASKPAFKDFIKLLKSHPNQGNKAAIMVLTENVVFCELRGRYCYPPPLLLKKMGITYQNLFKFKIKNADYYKLYPLDNFKRSLLGDIDNWKTGRPGMVTLDIPHIRKNYLRLL